MRKPALNCFIIYKCTSLKTEKCMKNLTEKCKNHLTDRNLHKFFFFYENKKGHILTFSDKMQLSPFYVL